ncbi:MAG: hypothetical protein HKP25_00640 [Marinicaulis sp.]|nr:hypothetical protein [Marinicaulis sp.]
MHLRYDQQKHGPGLVRQQEKDCPIAEDILIPLIVFTAIGIMVVSGFHLGYKKQRTSMTRL